MQLSGYLREIAANVAPERTEIASSLHLRQKLHCRARQRSHLQTGLCTPVLENSCFFQKLYRHQSMANLPALRKNSRENVALGTRLKVLGVTRFWKQTKVLQSKSFVIYKW